ncbi:D-tyrosyl-tRNA(Tyr) deacylase [Virgibacillus phasianinus]|uniref:D-aminoacyl-tRNA deacylase n=1 Tax=Virgibacillus phasianinus TaxID=2017483 RepID=A0A220U5V0_9BACI|nr:D-aminoacyl-tRNA deacylase [Virgibacillus phasianinus]ASK63093.1 D-tyrosyl-tRNA(Tyr) deacylase [Virgibacillus phasianinus]
MRAIIQRAKNASVTVNDNVSGKIDDGLVMLLGVTHDDTIEDAKYIVNKAVNLRIFEDANQKMNLSLKDVNGGVLSISQFTLYANTQKGRRPSFVDAAKPEHANELYLAANRLMADQGIPVETGIFGEMMNVQLTNVGPATFILDSNDK